MDLILRGAVGVETAKLTCTPCFPDHYVQSFFRTLCIVCVLNKTSTKFNKYLVSEHVIPCKTNYASAWGEPYVGFASPEGR